MVEHPDQSQANPGVRVDGTSCSIYFSFSALFALRRCYVTWHLLKLGLDLVLGQRLGDIANKEARFRLANVYFQGPVVSQIVRIELPGWREEDGLLGSVGIHWSRSLQKMTCFIFLFLYYRQLGEKTVPRKLVHKYNLPLHLVKGVEECYNDREYFALRKLCPSFQQNKKVKFQISLYVTRPESLQHPYMARPQRRYLTWRTASLAASRSVKVTKA